MQGKKKGKDVKRERERVEVRKGEREIIAKKEEE